VLPYLGSDERLRILVDDPRRALSGSLVEAHVYVEDGVPMIIHDRSGRPDVFPGELLSGPVLRVELLRPRRRPLVLYRIRTGTPRATLSQVSATGRGLGREQYGSRSVRV
jgi:hypothetical protein